MNTTSQNLTDAICATAIPSAKEYALKDSRFRGLQLRVQPCGGRSWIIRTRKDGKQLKRTLGRYPDVPLKTARQLAAAVLADGQKAPEATRKKVPTFREFHQQYELRRASGYKLQGYQAHDIYCRTQLLPAFGHMRLDEIDAPAINAWMARYSKHAPGGANRAFNTCGRCLTAPMNGRF
ncbi:MAG: Arm DNA-binding domain-containing protein [Pseudomonadota bacterium]